MYLERIVIKNYRSIKDLDIKFSKGKNIIVGRNNSGKSNIIKAVDIVLGENQPTWDKSENIVLSDFYSWKEKNEQEEEIINSKDHIFVLCVLRRDQEEPLDYNEINKCYGYHKYASGQITNQQLIGGYKDIFDINPDDLANGSGKIYVNPKINHQVAFKEEFDDCYYFAFAFLAKRDGDDIISKDMRFFYKQNESDDWTMAFQARIRNELLQSAILQSFRDPQSQLRISSWTWYGKLMRSLTADPSNDAELKDGFKKVTETANKIFSRAKSKIQSGTLDVAFPDSDISFQFHDDSKVDIYKNCKVYIDDGIKSPLSEKGSGIQSATIIGLFNYYTKEVNSVASALLCVEEPELYLHPHARRVISDKLDNFIGDKKNQVILTTHSSEFIRTTDESLNIILVRKGSDGTNASPINIKSNKSLLLNNNHNEIFFADKIIVCEGYDDYILRWVAEEKFSDQINGKNVSIITAGGKDGIPSFVDLILKLGIDCYIFTDFDFLLRDQTSDADKYKQTLENGKVLSKRHKSVENLNTNFFKQDCIFGSEGDNIIAKIKDIRNKIKLEEEKVFYEAKVVSEVVKNNVEAVKLLLELRNSGIGILDGEIENLSKDTSILDVNNKLSLDKIFQISREMMASGKKISDIIDTTHVEVFLKSVFKGL